MYRTSCIILNEEYWLRVRWHKLAIFNFPDILLSGGRVWLDIPNALLHDGTTHLLLSGGRVWLDIPNVLLYDGTTHLLLSGGRVWLDIPNALLYDGSTHCFLEVECDSTFLTSCCTTALLTAFWRSSVTRHSKRPAVRRHYSLAAFWRSSVTRHS